MSPDQGSVRRPELRRIGTMAEVPGVYRDLTVGEHLAFTADAYGLSRRGRNGRADELLDRAGLAVARDRLAGNLSGGMRQKLALILALLHEPDLLVLDEPTSGVDALARSQLWDEIHAAAEGGAAVLVSTHYLDEAARCDRIVLLAAGRVAAAGTAEELTAGRTAVQITAPLWQQAWQRLVDAGLGVLPAGRSLRVAGATPEEVRGALGDVDAEVTVVPATLDEVFLQSAAA